MSRHRLLLWAVAICLSVPNSVFAQLEFMAPGEKALVTALDFATTPGKPAYGGEVLYTSDGRVGLGGLFTAGGTPLTDALGAELVGSVVAPTHDVPLGVEVFSSYAYIWTSVSQSYVPTYYSGNSISVGAESYLSFPLDTLQDALQPFVGVARSFQSLASGDYHSNQAFYSFSYGCDAVEAVGPWMESVMVPGATYEEEHTYFDLTFSVCFRLH